jgi:hypothetical protein
MTDLLEKLKSTQQQKRSESLQTIRAVAERAAKNQQKDDDNETLSHALQAAGVSAERFQVLVDGLVELKENQTKANQIKRRSNDRTKAGKALRDHDQETERIRQEREAQRAELLQKQKDAERKEKDARKAARRVDELRQAMPELEVDAPDFDKLNLQCSGSVCIYSVDDAEQIEVSHATLTQQQQRRRALVSLAWRQRNRAETDDSLGVPTYAEVSANDKWLKQLDDELRQELGDDADDPAALSEFASTMQQTIRAQPPRSKSTRKRPQPFQFITESGQVRFS